eukprot:TRINITY_DN4219_c0_g1_i1.p2 TRINITY_DN4219_c0_g1~~TRINITY_DN4219_c0_g1_i1.p2  ORF type:complete len:139 (-),score=34.11 TRINITY_DN4219_c0_g1_i1:403-819(-)
MAQPPKESTASDGASSAPPPSLLPPPTSANSILMNPNRIPCFRKSFLTGLLFGGFGWAAAFLIKKDAKFAFKTSIVTFAVLSSIVWVDCRTKFARQKQLIAASMDAHPNMKSERELYRDRAMRLEEEELASRKRGEAQ